MVTFWTTCRVVFRSQSYRYLALGVFLLAVGLYPLTLPATFTGGIIERVSLRYLNAEMIFFSVTLALLLSLVVTFNLYSFRASLRRQGAGLNVGAAIADRRVVKLLALGQAVVQENAERIFGCTRT